MITRLPYKSEQSKTKQMNIQKRARLAGGLYLITVITGLFSLMYVPNKIFIWGDFAKAIPLLQEYEFLFRLSIVCEILCYIAFLFLPLVLYKLFEKTNKNLSLLMVLLVSIAVPISCIAVAHKLDILNALDKTAINIISTDQLQQQIGFYYSKINIAQIFWGLWLFPFGYVIYNSGLIPKFFWIFLMLGAFGYVINFVGFTLSPDYNESIISTIFKLPSSIGEIGTCLWLIIAGVKKETNIINDKK